MYVVSHYHRVKGKLESENADSGGGLNGNENGYYVQKMILQEVEDAKKMLKKSTAFNQKLVSEISELNENKLKTTEYIELEQQEMYKQARGLRAEVCEKERILLEKNADVRDLEKMLKE